MCPSSFEGDIALLVIIVIIWGGGISDKRLWSKTGHDWGYLQNKVITTYDMYTVKPVLKGHLLDKEIMAL